MEQKEMWKQAANGTLGPTKISEQIVLISQAIHKVVTKLVQEKQVDNVAAVIDGHINSMLTLCITCTNGQPPPLGNFLESLATIYMKHVPIQIARHKKYMEKQQEAIDDNTED